MESLSQDSFTSLHERSSSCWTASFLVGPNNDSDNRSRLPAEDAAVTDAFLSSLLLLLNPSFDHPTIDHGSFEALDTLESLVCRNASLLSPPPPPSPPMVDVAAVDWGFGSVMKTVIVPTICAVGMAGNLLTLLVLSRKRLKVS